MPPDTSSLCLPAHHMQISFPTIPAQILTRLEWGILHQAQRRTAAGLSA